MEREIIHRCGHAQHHHVAGYFVADQDREARRLTRRACARCARTATATAASDRPAAVPAGTGAGMPETLPPLNGSVRQVAWAEAIRRDRLAALHRLDPAGVAAAAAVADARWWIDHRADDPRMLAAVAA